MFIENSPDYQSHAVGMQRLHTYGMLVQEQLSSAYKHLIPNGIAREVDYLYSH